MMMIRRIVGSSGVLRTAFPLQSHTVSVRGICGTNVRMKQEEDSKDIRDQLLEAVKQPSNQNNSQPSTRPSLHESLFSVLDNTDTRPLSDQNLQDDLGLSSNAASRIHPRDVAKNIRVNGPLAGRTVDTSAGGVSYAVGGINSIIRNNKIRYLQRIQSRYIPPGKYKNQLKREWWRRRFFQGFKGLMAQVNDARRRGY